MKINRTYSLDDKIVKILDKMKNKSSIIERLLREYFIKIGKIRDETSLAHR